jgi:hypothetical protein
MAQSSRGFFTLGRRRKQGSLVSLQAWNAAHLWEDFRCRNGTTVVPRGAHKHLCATKLIVSSLCIKGCRSFCSGDLMVHFCHPSLPNGLTTWLKRACILSSSYVAGLLAITIHIVMDPRCLFHHYQLLMFKSPLLHLEWAVGPSACQARQGLKTE